MPDTLQKKSLLPNGFHDILPQDAPLYHHTANRMLSIFEHYGYSLVIPPMIEFEDSLFSNSGEAVKHQTFRLMDPMSQKMMGLRADITAQIARIASTRLVNEVLPLRLSYTGQVFRVKGTDLHAERQAIQAGIELIGEDTAQTDAESVIIALDTLTQLGIENLSIDFNIPLLASVLLQDITLSDTQYQQLQKALNKKDIAAIRAFDHSISDLLTQLAIPQSDAKAALKHLNSLPLPKEAKALCAHLEDVIRHVKASRINVHITIDPLEQRGFEFHTTIGFAIFAKNYTGELGRGGHYIINGPQGSMPASGATLYVNDICRLLAAPEARKTVLVPADTALEKVKALHQQRYNTLFTTAEISNLMHEAQRLHCHAILKDGKVESLA